MPRVILKINLPLDDKKRNLKYPSRDAPYVQIEGYFAKKAYQIVTLLQERFEAGSQIIFDWFTFVKDELFADPTDINKYNPNFFSSTPDHPAILSVRDSSELNHLFEELRQTAFLHL